MSIDYGRLISRTWEIFWNNKVLWILGLIAAFGAGGFNFNFNTNTRSTTLGTSSTAFGDEISQFWARWGGLLILLGIVIVIISIALSFIRAAAQSALIATTDHIASGNPQPSFRAAWGLGWPHALRLWLLYIVVGLLGLLVALVALIPVFLVLFTALGPSSSGSSAGGAALLLFCCICGGVIVAIPVAIVVGLILEYAPRAIVLDNEGIILALRSGWRLLRANFGPSLVTWLITVGVAIVQGIISFVVLLPFGLVIAGPALFSLISNPDSFSVSQALGLLVGALILGLIASVVAALFTTFDSVLWTNLYRHLRQKPNGSLAPLNAYGPAGGGYYPNQQQPPYGGQYGQGAPTTQMPPTYGSQPPYSPPQYGGQPPYSPPQYGGPSQTEPLPPNQNPYGGQYNSPPQGPNPEQNDQGDQGRVDRS